MKKAREDGKSGRISRAKGRVKSRPWGLLVAANALPIVFAIVIGTLYAKGTIEFVPGAEKVVPSLVILGVTLVILAAIAWIIAPVLFPLVKRTQEFIDRNLALLFEGSPMAIPLRVAFVALGVVAYGVLWANLVVLALLALVDTAAIIASLAVFVREALKARG